MANKTTDALDLLTRKPPRASGHYAEKSKLALPPVPEPLACCCDVERKKAGWISAGCPACVPTIAPMVDQKERRMR